MLPTIPSSTQSCTVSLEAMRSATWPFLPVCLTTSYNFCNVGYVNERLDIRETLARRLKKLSTTEFEDLLHPVFQEDEVTLIATGGVLGFGAGALQTKLGWGGPSAVPRAMGTIVLTLVSSMCFYLHQKYEAQQDPPLASKERPHLRRRETVLRPTKEIAEVAAQYTSYDYR